MTNRPAPEAKVYRWADLPALTQLSRPTLHRHVKAGIFPKPDRVLGRTPLWFRATIDKFLTGDQAGTGAA